MRKHPNQIGPDNFELWTGRIELDPSLTAADVQATVTDYVAESGITVVGYHTEEPPALTMLRWPDGREGYQAPTPAECDIALAALAARFGSNHFVTGIVPDNKIHTMLGRNKDGYHVGEVASLQEVQDGVPNASVTDGHMISARTTPNGVEPYGEPVGVIIANPPDEEAIHTLGDELEQHHYAIEHGARDGNPGRTDFWETRWSPTYVTDNSQHERRIER